MAFANRVSNMRHDLAHEIHEITETYTVTRYANAKLSDDYLNRLVRRFDPHPRRDSVQ